MLQSEVKAGNKSALELEYIHVKQEILDYDPSTGEKLSRPSLQIYDLRNWENPNLQEYLHTTGVKTTILYDPRPKKEGKKKENVIDPETDKE